MYLNQGLELTPGMLAELYRVDAELTGNVPHCVLADVSRDVSSTEEARKYAANNEFMQSHIAYAMIGKTLPVNILANFFINVNRPKVPTRLFRSEEDASKWLLRRYNDYFSKQR